MKKFLFILFVLFVFVVGYVFLNQKEKVGDDFSVDNAEYINQFSSIVSKSDFSKTQRIINLYSDNSFVNLGSDEQIINPEKIVINLISEPGMYDTFTTVDNLGKRIVVKSFSSYYFKTGNYLKVDIYLNRSLFSSDEEYINEFVNYSKRAVFLVMNPEYLGDVNLHNQVDDKIDNLLDIRSDINTIVEAFLDIFSTSVNAQCVGTYDCGTLVNNFSCTTPGGNQTCVNTCTRCCGLGGNGNCQISGQECAYQGTRNCSTKSSQALCNDSSNGACSSGQCVVPGLYSCSWTGGGGGPVVTNTPTPTVGPNTPIPTSPPASCSGWCTNAGSSCADSGLPTAPGTCSNGGQCCGNNNPGPQCDGAREIFNLTGSFNPLGGLDLTWVSSSVFNGPGPSSFWSDPHHFNIKLYRNVNSPGTRIYENNSIPGSLPVSYGTRSYTIPQSGAYFLPGQSLSPGTYVVRVSGRDNCDSVDPNREIVVCTPPLAPTVFTPSPGLVSSGSTGANNAVYYFGADPGANLSLSWNNTGATRYAIRIDDLSNPWNPGAMNPGDSMNDSILTNTYSFVPTRGRSYRIWLHAVNCNGVFSAPIALTYNALVNGRVQGRLLNCPANTAVTVSGLGTYTMPTAQAGVSSWFYSAAMWGGDSRTVSVSIPGSYTAAHSLCANCTTHNTYTPGSSIVVNQPNVIGSYNDLYFSCTPAAGNYQITLNPVCAAGTPNTSLVRASYQVGSGALVNLPNGQLSYSMSIPPAQAGLSWFYVNGAVVNPTSVSPNITWDSGFAGSSMRIQSSQVNPGSYTVNLPLPASACVVPTPTSQPPFCTVTSSPLVVNLSGGTSTVVSSAITLGPGSTISQVRYGSYDTSIASVLPTSRSAAGPFTTTVTASSVNSGNTAVWTAVDLVGRPNACSTQWNQDTDVNVTPLPPCTATVTLSDPGVLEAGGLSVPLTATVVTNRVGCVVNRVDFIVSSPNLTNSSISPSNDSVPPFITNLTPGNITGVVQIVGNAYIGPNFVGGGSRNVSISCTPPDDPTGLTVTDEVFQVRLNWVDNSNNETGFTIQKSPDNVNWSNLDSVGPNITTYLETGSAVCGVQNYYRVRAVNNTKPIACQGSAWVTNFGGCEDYESWYASGGGSMISSGNMQSNLPSWAPGPFVGLSDVYMINDPLTGTGVGPGMAIASSFSGFTAAQANSQSWQEQAFGSLASLLSRNENTYQSMYERVTARVTPINVNQAVINGGNIGTVIGTPGASNIISGVTVLRRVGNVNINDLRLVNRRVLLFVEGNVDISDDGSSGIGTSLDNNSFLAIIASGSISISPRVGDPNTTVDGTDTVNLNTSLDIRSSSYTPHLEGIFFASHDFTTGGIDTSINRHRLLRIDGSVIGMNMDNPPNLVNGIGLQRSVKSPLPSTYVVFRPDLTYQLSQVGLRRKTFQELLNP